MNNILIPADLSPMIDDELTIIPILFIHIYFYLRAPPSIDSLFTVVPLACIEERNVLMNTVVMEIRL